MRHRQGVRMSLCYRESEGCKMGQNRCTSDSYIWFLLQRLANNSTLTQWIVLQSEMLHIAKVLCQLQLPLNCWWKCLPRLLKSYLWAILYKYFCKSMQNGPLHVNREFLILAFMCMFNNFVAFRKEYHEYSVCRSSPFWTQVGVRCSNQMKLAQGHCVMQILSLCCLHLVAAMVRPVIQPQ